jgi:hypothetical protein
LRPTIGPQKGGEKVGRQELRSTPYKQEIDHWSFNGLEAQIIQQLYYFQPLEYLQEFSLSARGGFHKSWMQGVKHRAHPNLRENAIS